MTTIAPPSSKADLGSLARGGVLSLIGAATSAIAGVGLVALVTRAFSRDEAGVFFAAGSLFLLGAAVAKLGAETGLVYFISRQRVLDQRDRIRRVIAVAFTPVTVAAVLVATTLFAAAPWLAEVAVDGPAGHFTVYVRTLACFLPLAVLTDTLLAATRGFRTQRPTTLIEGIGRPLGQIVLVVIVVATASTSWLGLAWALPYLPAAVLAGLWLGVLLPRSVRAPAAGGMAGEFWRYTWPRTFAAIAQLALQRLDIVLVAALRGPADAAIYTAATRFLVVGQLGSRAISTAVQPQIGEQLALGATAEARTLYRTATAWLMLLVWPLYLLCVNFAGPVMALFGHGYAAGEDVILVLTGAMLVATGCGMVDMVLSMSGRTSWNLVNTLLALAVNIGVDLLLIPHIGIMGAAIGWAAAIVFNNVVPLGQIALVARLHPFGMATLTAGALAALCFGVLPLLARIVAGDGLLPLIAAAASGTILYGLGCWWFRRPLRLTSLRALRGRTTRKADA
ncbi:MAG TPA: polysaccharide biosynthesis C-terminal domain-containing protein [Streptosporangiaceae bacterium]|jgi:O-antigen/teichoic acid export membrane protein